MCEWVNLKFCIIWGIQIPSSRRKVVLLKIICGIYFSGQIIKTTYNLAKYCPVRALKVENTTYLVIMYY